MLTEATLTAIIEQAKKATPGPWAVKHGTRSLVCRDDEDHYEVVGVFGAGDSYRHRKANQHANAEYLAAVDPCVGQQMAEEILRLREANARLSRRVTDLEAKLIEKLVQLPSAAPPTPEAT